MTVSGNWLNGGTFNAGDGDVIFTGGVNSITSGGDHFHKITLAVASSYEFKDAIFADGVFVNNGTIQNTTGAVAVSAPVIFLAGDVGADNDNITFDGPVIVMSDVHISTGSDNGDIWFKDMLLVDSGDEILTLTAGAGEIKFDGPVGSGQLGAKPAAYWSFDDGTATDNTGNGYDGTIVGSPAPVAGKVGGALYFSGSGDYINIGYDLDVPSWESYSVSVWFLNDGGGDHSQGYGQKIIDKTVYWHDFYLSVNPDFDGTLVYRTYEGSGAGISDPDHNYMDSTWHHAVIVKDGSYGELWVDGVLVGTHDSIKTVYSSGPLLIGYSLSSDSYQRKYWSGMIDEVAVWDEPLSSADVAALYNDGDGMSLVTSGTVLAGIIVNSASDVTFADTVNIGSFTQASGTGATNFQGSTDLTGTLTASVNTVNIFEAMMVAGPSDINGDVNLNDGASWTLQDTLDISGALLVEEGATIDLAGSDITAGTLDNRGTFRLIGDESVSIPVMNDDAGLFLYYGTGSYSGLAAGYDHYDLTFSSSGAWELLDALNVNAQLEIGSGVTLDTGNSLISVGDDLLNYGYITSSSGGITLNVSGDIFLYTTSGSSVSTAGGNITFGGSVLLGADTSISTGSGPGDINFNGTLNGLGSDRDLYLLAGSGDISFEGAVSQYLGLLTITSASNVYINDSFSVNGIIDITADNVRLNSPANWVLNDNLNVDGELRLAGGEMHLGGHDVVISSYYQTGGAVYNGRPGRDV